MTTASSANRRQARLPGLLRRARAAVLASGLLAFAGLAGAAVISNTAALSYTSPGGVPVVQTSNTDDIVRIPAASPGVVTFWAYAPGGSGSSSIPFDGGEYDSGSGFQPLATPTRTNGDPISLASPVSVRETRVYHAGEPVFITLADANRNTDASVREYIEVVLTSTTGDREVLRLQETGADTGVFATVIQSVDSTAPVTQGDGSISLTINSRLDVNYQDPYYLTDISASAALVDPYGFVFDSLTGAPLDGAVVTMRVPGGGLATVFGDDGVSSYPATVTTGGTVTDGGGTTYTLPTGGFRFPFVAPGDYYFEVTPPAGYGVPSAVPTGSLANDPVTGLPYAIVTGSRGEVFTVQPGPALHIDIPADPASGQLFLQKQASTTVASAGDVLQYRLVLRNLAPVPAAMASIEDRLPAGFRYEAGSLRVNGIAATPAVSADGRTLTIPLGTLALGSSTTITYVTRVGPGTPVGDAVNSARASAAGGVLTSNAARVAVRVTEPLMSGQATLIGRVFEGDCSTPWHELRGVANARVMLEDGTYVVTDKDGQYHFKGVKPGTHVVQLDVDSLPDGLEPVSCIENTRFAGRSFSQFVDVRGGALWRADFHTRARRGSLGIRMHSSLATQPAVTVPDLGVEVVQSTDDERNYRLHAEFDSCEARLNADGEGDLATLVDALSGADIERIELVGNTDNKPLSSDCRRRFRDNQDLSEARARHVGDRLAAALGLKAAQIQVEGRGERNPLADNRSEEGRARNRRTEVRVLLNRVLAPQAFGATGDSRAVTAVSGMTHRIELDGSVPAAGVKVTALLPDGASYAPGSARVDGRPVADPVQAGGALVFPVPDGGAEEWTRVIEFESRPVVAGRDGKAVRRYTLRARFDSCRSSLHANGRQAVDHLVAQLRRQGKVTAVELTGHGDGEALAPACAAIAGDAGALSAARAAAIGQELATAFGLAPEAVVTRGAGNAEPVADSATAAGRARNRRVELRVHFAVDPAAAAATAGPAECPAEALGFRASGGYVGADKKRVQTPAVENALACPPAGAAASSTAASSERRAVEVTGFARLRELPPELLKRQRERAAQPDEITASGGRQDWLADATPAPAWLFPGPGHNPRSPATRIVIKHAPGQTVQLRGRDGTEVGALSFEGTRVSADRRHAVSLWRGVPLAAGSNAFVAEIRNADGSLAAELRQDVHFAGQPVRAELVPEKSILLADGIHTPVIAVRLLDRDGRPVRHGMAGPLRVRAPYRLAEEVRREQERQLAGRDRFDPQFRIEGDEGIAYVELAPTTDSGNAVLEFSFQPDERQPQRRQDIRAWLEPQPRDWVVVGFAEGTVGYQTLSANAQPLAGTEEGSYSDGQVSLYAKGRVLGKWLLTMAYDSDKTRDRQSLLGSIDPQQFYTLYGDGTEQRYDAASQEKLYLKLERGQFYALFGDYETGLGQTQLSRYNRTLNGFKTEKAGGPVVFTAFAAETPQLFARDEIQGNGTSGLYRLTQRDLVLNSERIRLETRDRLQSQRILSSQALTRHIDYDIDYSAGTLFFRQPVPSRDTAFNPVYIVAEYETLGVADEPLNAGGRLGVELRGGAVQAGVSAIRDEQRLGRSDLVGADLKLRLGRDAELRVEAAQTEGEYATLTTEGMAWLTEYELHNGRYDLLAYARRQEPRFGLNQQNLSEAGTQKVGVDGQVRLSPAWSVLGQVYQTENLVADTVRDAAQARVQYKTPKGGAGLGLQAIRDSANSGALAGQDFHSEQALASANRFFFNQRLELSAQAETAVGGNRDSADYPDRYLAAATFALTSSTRLLAGQEFTDGAAVDSSTTRVGLQATPWKGARLDSTLNQSETGEYGPRTFGLLGLTQALLAGERWGLDVSVDSSQTLRDNGAPQPPVNATSPVASGATTTEDFVAVSTGATYRAPLWSWNGRLEHRDGDSSDRQGLVSGFLRNAQAGVAFSSRSELFHTEQATGAEGWLGRVDLAWAWRPLGSQWSLLNRLELRYEDLEGGSALVNSGLFGNDSLVASDASVRRIINNFALNRVSREWTAADRQGNLFRRYERNQWSLYYGAKYAQDSFDGVAYDGYIDLIGLEVRHDLTEWLDLGLQASSLNAWEDGQHAYSFGPMVGASPVTNGWITLGWNLRGFRDSDFDAARYTAQGPYLQLRFKFDQTTRLRDAEKSPGASATNRENRLK